MKPYVAIAAVSFFFMLNACNESAVYIDSEKISGSEWAANDTLVFNVSISEPEQYYDIFLNITASKKFRTQNLWLFYEVTAPDGTSQNDTIEYYLFDDVGRPFGKPSGDFIDYGLAYKSYVLFPQKGDYRFKIQHGMRERQNPLVAQVEFVVKKSKHSTEQ